MKQGRYVSIWRRGHYGIFVVIGKSTFGLHDIFGGITGGGQAASQSVQAIPRRLLDRFTHFLDQFSTILK